LYGQRRGCLGGLLNLFLLTAAQDWLQRRFGFGRGCSCSGIGCGVIILVVFVILVCGTILGTDWTALRF
jgi:hypothetical protein